MRKLILAVILTAVIFTLAFLWAGDKNVQFKIEFNTFTPMPEVPSE